MGTTTDNSTRYIPFSNGTEAMIFDEMYCSKCKNAYENITGESVNDLGIEETEKAIADGKECKLKFHLELGTMIGDIPIETANEIGFTKQNHKGCDKFVIFNPIPKN